MNVDRELIELSAHIGNDPMLVQGGGGNTSIKRDGDMWVKASGTWLAEAGRRQIFVRVNLVQMRDELAHGREPPFLAASGTGAVLRPSIETSLHVALPHRVVAHYHSVNAIALSAVRGARSLFASLLEDVRWAWVPYKRPGMPLAITVQEALGSRPDVLILANHGVVVGGATPNETWSLIRELERRLEQPPRPSPAPDIAALETISSGTAYVPATIRELHAIATDPVNLQIARGGSLYPDHVVFLGPGIRVLEAQSAGREERGKLEAMEAPLVAVPGRGLLLRRTLTPGQREMANCLALVLPRIPAGARINYLTAEEEAQLLNWQAEAYRRAMDT